MAIYEEWLILATSLNGLDIRFRYPDIEFEPDETEVVDSIEWSKQVLDFVLSKCI